MLWRIGVVVLGVATAAPAVARPELEQGFAGALRGCEEWVLNPSSWAEGLGPFASTLGLGDKAGWVEAVDEAALPPKELRAANHYLRINSSANAGYILVVSDRLPMCHITGGGGTDFQPAVEAVLASNEFKSRWEKVQEDLLDDMASTVFRSREEPSFSMVISRAQESGERLDRVQVLATAVFDPGE